MFFEFMKLFNAMIVFLLYVEIGLKLADDGSAYLKDAWALTDLLLTVIVRIYNLKKCKKIQILVYYP